jgi:hypothetical protein
MGLPWVRVDTQFPSNPKVLYLVADKNFRAGFVWLASMAYAGAQGTDGFIPHAALPFIHSTPKEPDALMDVGLWVPAPGGWELHDWRDFQPSNAEMEERKKRAKAAAMKRWHGNA